MPKLAVAVEHSLTQQEAADRVKVLLEKVRVKYQGHVSDLQEEWSEHSGTFSFKAMGFAVKGKVAVEITEVRVEGEIPFAAMMFKGKIEQNLRENMERLLG